MTPVSHTLEPRSSAQDYEVYVPDQTRERPGDARFQGIAQRFVNARQDGRPLDGFPGRLPETLAEAYECQEAAIELWRDAIGGWKVGLIGSALARTFGIDRLAGPIFQRSIALRHRVAAGVSDHRGRLRGRGGGARARGRRMTRRATRWIGPSRTRGNGGGGAHRGRDRRQSLETINDFGPLAIVADFGNNAGLIVGPALRGWPDARTRRLALRDLHRRREPRTGARRRGAGRSVRVAALPVGFERGARAPAESRRLGLHRRAHGCARDSRRTSRRASVSTAPARSSCRAEHFPRARKRGSQSDARSMVTRRLLHGASLAAAAPRERAASRRNGRFSRSRRCTRATIRR